MSGNLVTQGNDEFFVQIIMTERYGQAIPPEEAETRLGEITDNQDGTYRVNYTAILDGTFRLDVTLNNEHIQVIAAAAAS